MTFIAVPDPNTGGVQGGVLNTATNTTVYYGFNYRSVAASMNQQIFGPQPKPPGYYSGDIHSDFKTGGSGGGGGGSGGGGYSILQNQPQQPSQQSSQGQSAANQDYATQIMDTAISAGLEHQKWLEQQQESLLQAYPKAFEALTPKASGLMEAGTAELMRAQKNAMHTVTSSLAAKGLLGSSAAESAYAKIAGETASKIGSLAADTQEQIIQVQASREAAYLQAMNQLLSIPTFQSYAELAAAGANASLFAVPTGGF